MPGPHVRRTRRRGAAARPALLAVLVCATPACTSANHYATPRLLAPGDVSVVGALEGTRVVRSREIATFGEARTTTDSFALYPAIMIRRGVAERLELGLSLRPSGFGGELKIGAWRSAGGARAAVLIAPSFQSGAAILDVPVLASLPVHERVELFVSPGLVGAKDLLDDRSTPRGLLARGGLGASARVSGSWRLVPEITLSTAIVGGTPLWMTGGLGVAGDL